MKFYITHDGWFFKEIWEEFDKAMWVTDREKATVYTDYSTAWKTACEVQTITESTVTVACVG